jgi:Caulimovirus viroplasmin
MEAVIVVHDAISNGDFGMSSNRHDKRKFYAVKVGRGGPAIYENWHDVSHSLFGTIPRCTIDPGCLKSQV